ncbi:MAG: PEP-CTERM sorting domain-containing protein [Verrucomicrobiota bacterium]|nr:PEP-CTERM sorting domain-containing protein [Verrucomicrobiota bacterium]
MKKLVLVISLAIAGMLPAARLSAQSASFVYSGVPTAPLMPGSSFTIAVSLVFTAGGIAGDLTGLSYWIAQRSPATPFPFSLTNRDLTGSVFGNPATTNVFFPQIIDSINRNPDGTQGGTDLGALGGLHPSGTYFVANLTFALSGNIAPGSYTLGNTTSNIPNVGGRISVITNSNGSTFPIAPSNFTVFVVPEPGSVSLIMVGALGAVLGICRRGLRRS